MNTDPVWLRLDRLDATGLQARAEFDEAFARDTLAQFLIDQKKKPAADREELPPAGVVREGRKLWLWDGNHRRRGYELAGRLQMPCIVVPGTYRDALLLCIGANATHGLYRSSADKRRAVGMLLDDAEWRRWNNCELARRAGVGEALVREMKQERVMSFRTTITPVSVLVERNGTIYTQALPPRAPEPPPVVLDDQQRWLLQSTAHHLTRAQQVLARVGLPARHLAAALDLLLAEVRGLAGG